MKNLLYLSTLLLLTSCAISYPNYPQTDQSKNGVVAAAQPLASKAGVMMLEKGGNAVDAAVASAFALSVVEPSMSGLGGRLQAIVRLPNGEVHGVDATTEAPMQYDTAQTPPVRYGYGVIGIPGVVAGLTKLHKEHGSLPLETVMKPAIRLAKRGFRLMPGEAKRHAAALEQLQQFKGSQQYFLREGKTRQAGEKWVQKDLAHTLHEIAHHGRDAFYKGEIAEKIVADFQANGGILTMQDMANYKAMNSLIVTGSYKGHDLHGLWLPSYGAITIELLHILENLPMGELEGADWASAVYQAINLSYKDRWDQKLPNRDSMTAVLLDKNRAKELAAQININGPEGTGHIETDVPESWGADGHTTHLTTADGKGMMVALTQSLGPNMGSKVATPGLGFLYAVTLGKYLGVYEPGARASSHISPFIIMKDGQPYMALGAAGGSRIVTAIAQATTRKIDHGLTLENALSAPRVHPSRDETTILLETQEGGWRKKDVEELKRRGFTVKEIPDQGKFGRVHAVYYDAEKKVWIGAADPDWEGAAGVEKK